MRQAAAPLLAGNSQASPLSSRFPFVMPTPRCALSVLGKLARLALLALTIGLLAPSAKAAIYKYTDDYGVTHYSDSYGSVPEAYRDQVRDVAPEMENMTGFNVVEGLNGGGAAGQSSDPAMPMASGFPSGEMLGAILGGLGIGVILILLVAIPIVLAVGGLILQLACRLAGADSPGLGRAVAILVVQGLAGAAVGAVSSGFVMALGVDEDPTLGASLGIGGASFILSWLVNAAVLTGMMDCDFPRALWVCVVHTLLIFVLVLVPVLLVGGLAFLQG